MDCLYVLSSAPSEMRKTTRPFLLRPVRPLLWMLRMGERSTSKFTMRSTSAMSSPSSPTHVHTSTLSEPSRNCLSTRCWDAWFIPAPSSRTGTAPPMPLPDVADFFLEAWPMNWDGRTKSPALSSSIRTISTTESRHWAKTMARVVVPPSDADRRWKCSTSTSLSLSNLGLFSNSSSGPLPCVLVCDHIPSLLVPAARAMSPQSARTSSLLAKLACCPLPSASRSFAYAVWTPSLLSLLRTSANTPRLEKVWVSVRSPVRWTYCWCISRSM